MLLARVRRTVLSRSRRQFIIRRGLLLSTYPGTAAGSDVRAAAAFGVGRRQRLGPVELLVSELLRRETRYDRSAKLSRPAARACGLLHR